VINTEVLITRTTKNGNACRLCDVPIRIAAEIITESNLLWLSWR